MAKTPKVVITNLEEFEAQNPFEFQIDETVFQDVKLLEYLKEHPTDASNEFAKAIAFHETMLHQVDLIMEPLEEKKQFRKDTITGELVSSGNKWTLDQRDGILHDDVEWQKAELELEPWKKDKRRLEIRISLLSKLHQNIISQQNCSAKITVQMPHLLNYSNMIEKMVKDQFQVTGGGVSVEGKAEEAPKEPVMEPLTDEQQDKLDKSFKKDDSPPPKMTDTFVKLTRVDENGDPVEVPEIVDKAKEMFKGEIVRTPQNVPLPTPKKEEEYQKAKPGRE